MTQLTPHILVTGGAGYIGSHVVKQLAAAGAHVVIIDDLSTGCAENILVGTLIVGDCGDVALVSRVLRDYAVTAVIHLAASIIVPESSAQPLRYYQNNVVNTCHLLSCCAAANITQFIFSSSAAVYGAPQQARVSEADHCRPINPYGQSKLICEQILHDISRATALRHVALRYFNVGGADPEGRIGLRNAHATTLIKVAAQVAVGSRPQLTVYGTDFPTPDGTGVRDYIHVEDIASAHLAALTYLRATATSQVLNCGYGHGYSVREVIATVERLAQTTLQLRELPRRVGDPAEIVADNTKILATLAWQPRFADLDAIIQSSLAWEKIIAMG